MWGLGGGGRGGIDLGVGSHAKRFLIQISQSEFSEAAVKR